MAAAKKVAPKVLVANVQVGNELFLAGSTTPKDIADQITNPNCWGKPDDLEETPAEGDSESSDEDN